MKKPLKIAIDIRNIGRNRTGSEVVILELVKHLLRIDKENQYKLLTDTEDEKVLNFVQENLELADKKNVEVVSLKAKNKFVWASWTVWRWAKKNTIDIYHTEYILPFFMPKSVKLVTHIHDVSFQVYRDLISWKDIYFLDILIPWSIKRADKIIAVSQFTKDEIEKYYPKSVGKIELVYNAVAENFAEPVEKECQKLAETESSVQKISNFKFQISKENAVGVSHWQTQQTQNCQIKNSPKFQEIRQKYNLPEKYILALGTMQPRKNIPFLIEAYSKILQKISKQNDNDLKNVGVSHWQTQQTQNFPKLVLVGKKAHNFDIEIEKKIKSTKELQENIIFTGYVDEKDKALVFVGAEIFVYPSLYEGFGIPPLEAIYCGVPIVISDIPPHREVFEEIASFFDPCDIDRCSKILYDTISDEKSKNEVFKKISILKDKFNYGKSAEKFLSVFNDLFN